MTVAFMVLAAAHAVAFLLGAIAGGCGRSSDRHRRFYAWISIVPALYLGAACAWADWQLLGADGILAGAGMPISGFAGAWCIHAMVCGLEARFGHGWNQRTQRA